MILKINGYEIYKGFGIALSSDRATANSFEIMNDPKPAFSHNWADEDGTEYDLVSPMVLEARVFTVSGTHFSKTPEDYEASKMAFKSILYSNYVTIEIPEILVKVNARLKAGGIKWGRLTPITDSDLIAVSVQFQFDEIMQDVDFKDNGSDLITYLVDSQLRYYNTQDNKFLIT